LLLPEAVDDYVGPDNPVRFIDGFVDGLEAETHRYIELIWLLRHLKPDFKTIADFRRDNRNAFSQVFREFVLLYRSLSLVGRELLAVDGTRIKAVNNKDRNFMRASLSQFIKAADAKLEDYLGLLDKSDGTESGKDCSRVKNHRLNNGPSCTPVHC
jgi:transposase